MDKMVKVSWIDSMTDSGSQSTEEHKIFATTFSDMQQTSLGIITYEGSTHICLACMIAPEGNVGLSIKIPKSAITKIEELELKKGKKK